MASSKALHHFRTLARDQIGLRWGCPMPGEKRNDTLLGQVPSSNRKGPTAYRTMLPVKGVVSVGHARSRKLGVMDDNRVKGMLRVGSRRKTWR